MGFKDSRFVFIIPLKGRALARNWANVLKELRGTVDSLLHQSEPDFRVVIACQDEPDVGIPFDERFEWLKIEAEPDPKAYHGDKPLKVKALGERLRQGGANDVYSMLLDGDDLVHRELVKYVLRGDNRRGYVMHTGYVYDYPTARLTVWDTPGKPFYHICGSTCVAYLTTPDLRGQDEGKGNYFTRVTRQSHVEVSAEQRGRPLEVLQFPGVVYRINHDESLQFRKKGLKKQGGQFLGARTAGGILEHDFAWSEGAKLVWAVLAKRRLPVRRES